MSALIGALRVTLGIDTAAFEQGLGSAQARIASAGAAMQAAGARIAGAGQRITAVMAPIGVALIAGARQGLEYASGLGEVAQQLGVTTDTLQEYRYAASQVGIEQETMDASLGRLTRSLGQAAGGTGPVAAAFATLGISIRDASGHIKSAGVVMPEIADALSHIADPAARAALEVQIFGRAGQQLDTLLAGGAAQINSLADAAHRLGIVLSSDDIAKADETADRLAAMKQVLEARLGTFVAQNADTILAVANGLASAAETILNAFSRLSPGMQQFALGFAAVATVAGPVLMAVGSLTSLLGGLVTALSPVLSVFGLAFESGGVMLLAESAFAAVSAAVGSLIASLAPLLVPIAAIAAVGALIYANWDKIGPALSAVGDKFNEVLGPKITALIDTVTAALDRLWQGPLGEAIRAALPYIEQFGAVAVDCFGERIAGLITALGDVVVNAFGFVVDAVRLVVNVLAGDWRGAWDAAKALVVDAIGVVLGTLNSLAPGAGDAVRNMVTAIGEWLGRRLNAIWDGVKAKIDWISDAFFGLYDAVVGHSYIPDMVDGIGANMARLQALMVEPAQRATASTGEAFRTLASDVSGLLDRLFPVQAQIRSVLDDMATLERALAAGQIDQRTFDEAHQLLSAERGDLMSEGEQPIQLITIDEAAFRATVQQVVGIAQTDLARPIEDITSTVSTCFADMMQSVTESVQGIVRQIKSGDFLGALNSVMGTLQQAGVFGGGAQAGTPGGDLAGLVSGIGSLFAGRASGGPVMANTPYIVGERRAELFVPSTAGRIAPNVNDNGRAAQVVNNYYTLPSDEFWGQVDGRAATAVSDATPGLIRAGAQAGVSRMANLRERSLAG